MERPGRAVFGTAMQALADVDIGDVGSWPDERLRGALVDGERLASRLRSVQAGLVAELQRRELATRDGCASPAAWLSDHLGVSRAGAARRLPLCGPHHSLVHEGGWVIRAAPGGRLRFDPPRRAAAGAA